MVSATHRILRLAIVFGAFHTLPLNAAKYFVATSGSDGNSGSNAAPWQTLQHAADEVSPGDRVEVLPGGYTGFHLTTSGLANSPIEFVAQPGVIINQRNAVTPDGINLEGVSHVVIDGFGVTGMDRAGVRSVGADENDFAEHVTIRNVTSSNNGYWGIFTGFVNDLLIENNKTSGSINEHGIYVSNSGDRPIIRNNESFGNRANGIHINGDASLGGDGIISGALVSGNTIHDNGLGGGSGINMDGVQDSRIENNLIYNNHASGISLYQIDAGGGASGNVVINNTVHQPSDGRWALNIQDESVNNTVLNNILISDLSFRGAMDISPDAIPGLHSDYNVVISRFTTDGGDSVIDLAEWQISTNQDEHSLAVHPANYASLFADLAQQNYHLSPTSLARDSGTTQLAPLYDLLGQARPSGAGFDIGAYELVAVLTGDFDHDGDVDGRDFLVWQRGGSPNGINSGDLASWQSGYGNPPPFTAAANAVPEPTSVMLMLFGVGLLGIGNSSRIRSLIL